jgi:hypothetical protein
MFLNPFDCRIKIIASASSIPWLKDTCFKFLCLGLIIDLYSFAR